jgi:hypothetical protein
MTDEQKKYDRKMVAAIPDLLAQAGYTLVQLEDTNTTDDPEDEE